MEKEIDWMSQAECRGREPMIFHSVESKAIKFAKSICGECVVREDCLDFALATKQEHGVWGGTDERERRRLRRVNITSSDSLSV